MERLEVSEDEWARFMALRAELFAEIKRLLEDDGHGKSYEGHFAVRRSLPNYFDEKDSGNSDWPWTITLGCYLVGPHRHYTWTGSTFNECLVKVEIDVRAWMRGEESRHFQD